MREQEVSSLFGVCWLGGGVMGLQEGGDQEARTLTCSQVTCLELEVADWAAP